MKITYSRLNLYVFSFSMMCLLIILYKLISFPTYFMSSAFTKLLEIIIFSGLLSLLSIFLHSERLMIEADLDGLTLWGYSVKKITIKQSEISNLFLTRKTLIPLLTIQTLDKKNRHILFLTDGKNEKVESLKKVLRIL